MPHLAAGRILKLNSIKLLLSKTLSTSPNWPPPLLRYPHLPNRLAQELLDAFYEVGAATRSTARGADALGDSG